MHVQAATEKTRAALACEPRCVPATALNTPVTESISGLRAAQGDVVVPPRNRLPALKLPTGKAEKGPCWLSGCAGVQLRRWHRGLSVTTARSPSKMSLATDTSHRTEANVCTVAEVEC